MAVIYKCLFFMYCLKEIFKKYTEGSDTMNKIKTQGVCDVR
jgi:hypothetical protein